MRVAIISSTQFGLQCLEQGILPSGAAEVVGIITTPSEIRISYSAEPVKIRTHADFSTVASRVGAEVAVLDGKITSDSYKLPLTRWKADLMLVLGWYFIVPKSVRAMTPKGCLGIHASLLPKYRGGAPIPWVIINGEQETGVTLFHLEDGVDDGDIVAQRRFPVLDEDTCASLYDRATEASVAILCETLPRIADGTAGRIAQDQSQATSFPQRSPADGAIDWSWDSARIHNFVRAQTRPYPGAFSFHNGERVTFWRTRRTNVHAPARCAGGTVVVLPDTASASFGICCSDGGVLEVSDVEPRGFRPAPGHQFSGNVKAG